MANAVAEAARWYGQSLDIEIARPGINGDTARHAAVINHESTERRREPGGRRDGVAVVCRRRADKRIPGMRLRGIEYSADLSR